MLTIMSQVVWLSTSIAAMLWASILMLPWQPWRVREILESEEGGSDHDLTDVTVVIPARDEAPVIGATLRALAVQGRHLSVILVDDHSCDGTAQEALRAMPEGLLVIPGKGLPAGWSGKLWAQQQGLHHVATPMTLLLDADIELAPGVLGRLLDKAREENLHLVSLLAAPHLSHFWEKLLMPAFVYFFKMLYPFALANSKNSKVAAAAGGCMLMETRVLKAIGGLEGIKGAIIDDCALARTVKSSGYRIWVGLSRTVASQRPYHDLSEIWNMVARTAFTQLRYSVGLLAACAFFMLLLFWMPVLASLFCADSSVRVLALTAFALMLISYLPTLRFYGRHPLWALTMPLAAALYLMMTWSSAIRYWKGERSRWKGRVYRV